MEGTSMLSHDLPPGFGFHPTDEELITHYLKQKVMSSSSPVVSLIADIDLYKFDPWELPEKALFGKVEWFFFSPRDRKYPNGDRPNRAATSGYWKANGSDKPILSNTASGSQCLGVKKSLVFYKGKPSKGAKTDWVMDEYRLLDDAARSPKLQGSMRLDDWVLCRVRQKSNNTTQTGDYNKHENSYGKSPSLVHQYLKEQARKKKNEVFEGCNHYLLGHLMGSPQEGSSTTVHSCNCMYQSTSLEESLDLQLPDLKITSNEPQVPMVSSFQNMLESTKRTLSIGALDEHVSGVPPNKRLASSFDDHWDNLSWTNVEEELFPTVSTTSVLNPSCFSSRYSI